MPLWVLRISLFFFFLVRTLSRGNKAEIGWMACQLPQLGDRLFFFFHVEDAFERYAGRARLLRFLFFFSLSPVGV